MTKKLMKLCMVALMSVASTAAWALSEVNGFYQIGTAADIAAFAQLVNSGNVYANAVLTADIELGDITTKISNDANKYQGLFDGAGHTIIINFADREDGEGPALFRNLGNRGIIQNLKVQGNIATGTYKHTAAIANYSVGLIRNCYVDVVITSTFGDSDDASIGGIAGQLNRPAIIENCLAKIKILGETTHKCGGVAAWVDEHHVTLANNLVINSESNFNWSDGKSAGLARVSGSNPLEVVNLTTYNTNSYTNRPKAANGNNYVTDNWGVDNVGTTVVTVSELKSGKVCFQLNSDQSHIGWVQNIGTDPFPVPAPFGTGRVYASAATNCQGIAEGVSFSNTGSDKATKHTYDKYGVCTTCGQFNFNGFEFDDPTRFEPVTKSVLIGSEADLYLAEGWNRLQNGFKLNMKLVNDVTCTPPTGQLVFNASDWMDSSFDGQGHTVTVNFVDIKENGAAFLPYFDGNFENVIMHGSISTANSWAGSIAGRFYGNGQLIRNVFSDITINTTKTGDNTSGGFVGIDNTNTTFENCIYAGDLIGVPGTQCLGGFAGWANNKTYYKNCAFLGTMTNGGGDSHTISRNNGNADCTNVYSTFKNGSDLNKYTLVSSDDVENGRLCYMLNGNEGGVERFYQLLGTDPMPMPFAKEGALVYATAYCGEAGNPAGCTNTPTTPSVVNHPYVDGWCSVCGKMQENYLSPVNGWYEIGTPGQLAWWSNDAANNTTTNARLTADIDMTGYSQYYVPVGNTAKLFTAEFDGQEHTISNLAIRGGDYTGVFGTIGNGAKIKNFVLDNTCSISGKAFCGIAGGTNGNGDVYLMNLGNEGLVKGTDQNVCGILGVDMSGSANLHISNCYVTGAVKGARESATICGWSNGSSVIENCYSIATLEGILNNDSFTRGGGAVLNCYELDTNGKQASTKKTTAEEVASGALCYKLNGDQATINWYQNLDTNADAYPLPFSSHAQVYANASYTCNGKPKGDVVYANVNDEHHDSHTEENGFCSKCGTMLSYVADYMTPAADGYYEIADNKQMRWFAATVNNGIVPTNTNARLVADIDFTDIMDYAPIGKEGVLYSGTFNGQGHALSNLVIESDENYIGVFGRIGNGANIKNFVLESTCSIKGNAFCGIVGGTNNGGDVYLSNLGNEGTVTGTAENASGILGVDMGGSATLHITNCYVTGAVKGDRESATICSWSNNQSVVQNCYSTATLQGIYGTNSLTRGDAAVVNCYEIESVGQQTGVNKVTAEEVANGVLAYKLNSPAFGQLLGTDTHPVFGAPEVSYIGKAGYATMYDTTTGYELNGDVTAYVAVLNETWLALTEIENVPESTPVILKGSYYNKIEANLPAINIANDLLGTAADTEADGSMYILAKPEGMEVGFYQATGTIPAGKAYYKSTSGAKAFYFAGDDATGIMTLSNSTIKDENIYNIAGQRLNKMQKGINIINGKKVLK